MHQVKKLVINRLRLVKTRNWSRPVQDCKKPVLSGPVRPIGTLVDWSQSRSISQKGKNWTGPDFQALGEGDHIWVLAQWNANQWVNLSIQILSFSEWPLHQQNGMPIPKWWDICRISALPDPSRLPILPQLFCLTRKEKLPKNGMVGQMDSLSMISLSMRLTTTTTSKCTGPQRHMAIVGDLILLIPGSKERSNTESAWVSSSAITLIVSLQFDPRQPESTLKNNFLCAANVAWFWTTWSVMSNPSPGPIWREFTLSMLVFINIPDLSTFLRMNKFDLRLLSIPIQLLDRLHWL